MERYLLAGQPMELVEAADVHMGLGVGMTSE